MIDDLIETGSFAPPGFSRGAGRTIRVVSWNINRGSLLAEVVESLRTLAPDLLFLQEVDYRTRRTGFRNISAEIAQALQMNYVFGAEFQELSQSAAGIPAFHGQATLSRSAIASYKILRFDHQSGFWRPRWFIPKSRAFQRRNGGRMALMVRLEILGTSLATYNLHLESRGKSTLRVRQLGQLLQDACSHSSDVPVLLAGDFNCDLTKDPVPPELTELKIVPNPQYKPPVTTRERQGGGRNIDWILVRGPLQVRDEQVHQQHGASDHFPLGLTLELSAGR